MKKQKQKLGFTLIEMLVVVAIIAILAVLAIANYGAAQRTARLDILTDTIVSTLKGQQIQAKSGKVISGKSGTGLKCYGVLFSTQDGVQQISTDYYLQKNDKADYCDTSLTTKASLDADSSYVVKKIAISNLEKNELVILFKPPYGRAFLANQLNEDFASPTAGTEIRVTIGIKNTEDYRIISIDPVTGLYERLYEKK